VVYGQSNWLYRGGGNSHDEALDIATDASGNYYMTGYKTGDAEFGADLLLDNGFSDIFLSKTDPNGNFLWSIDAGGPAADRAYSVHVDGGGFSYITGYFNGVADFGGISLTATAGSQDFFIAKYNPAGGIVWAQNFGGSNSESGYDVELDNLGNLIVTGQFKGTMTLGAATYTSAIDPGTGIWGFDIFIMKLDPSGNILWSKHGDAPYDDRGLDIAVDNMNNIFVCGQFSDTIVFDNQYDNNVQNAGFVMKMDENGAELWFDIYSAGQSVLYSIEHDGSNNVIVAGSFIGNLLFRGPSGSIYYPTSYTYNTLITKMDAGGESVWISSDGSDNLLTARDLTIDSNDDIYITGNFKCEFTEYSDILGNTVFNSAGHRDVFITKYDDAGTRQWYRQYGGQRDDFCSAIVINSVDQPVIAGGYGGNFWVPGTIATFDYSPSIHDYESTLTVCAGMANNYFGVKSAGNKDVFITKPYNVAAGHYFFYDDPSCDYSWIEPCIQQCMDTVEFCGPDTVWTDKYTHPAFGPLYNYWWSNGDNTSFTEITTTTDIDVKIATIDGCHADKDTAHVIVYPLPTSPHLTDDGGFNTTQYPDYNLLQACYPDTIYTEWGGLASTDTLIIGPPGGTTPIYVDSLHYGFDESGKYYIFTENEFGCRIKDSLHVSLDVPTPPDTIIPFTTHPDTLQLCEGQEYTFQIFDSITNPSATLPYCLPMAGYVYVAGNLIPFPCGVVPFEATYTGWYYMHGWIATGHMNYCGVDTLLHYFEDSVYVVITDRPTISGLSPFCPGDTVTLYASGDPLTVSFDWNGPGIVQDFSDSVWVDAEGLYEVRSVFAPGSGCLLSERDTFRLEHKDAPLIDIFPSDGVICPGDSMYLQCEPGIDYYWVGPDGHFGGNTQSAYGHTPGFYHCVMTDLEGCVLTSETVELYEWSTPFIMALPGTEICHSGTIDLEVLTTGTATIEWQPPLSGSSSYITVDSAGVYTVEVTQCGFTASASVTITDAGLSSNITPLTDTIVCPGDTVILLGPPGMNLYVWSDGTTGETNYITDTGAIELTVYDADGCSSTSMPMLISHLPYGTTPVASDTTICYGDSALLVNTNPAGTIWQDASGSIIAIGDSLMVSTVYADTTIYMLNEDTLCASIIVPVEVRIHVSSLIPLVAHNDSICEGDSIFLSTDTVAGANYYWTDPLGNLYGGSNLSLLALDTVHSGTWQLYIEDGTCTSGIAEFDILVSPLPFASLDQADQTICSTDSLVVSAIGTYSDIIWPHSGGTISSETIDSAGAYWARVSNAAGCSANTDTLNILIHSVSMPMLNDTSICLGQDVTLGTGLIGTHNWYSSAGSLLASSSTYTTPVLTATETYFVSAVDITGCESPLVAVTVTVSPGSGSPVTYGDTSLCQGENLHVFTYPLPGAGYQWTLDGSPVGFGTDIFIPSALPSNSGDYILTIIGVPCVSVPDTIHVQVHPTPTVSPVAGPTTVCDGDEFVLVSDNDPSTTMWIGPTGSTSFGDSLIYWPVTMADSGSHFIQVTDQYGCMNAITYDLHVDPTPDIGPISMPSDLCETDTAFFEADSVPGVVSYVWTGPASFYYPSPSGLIANVTPADSGIYTLVVENAYGCSDTATTHLQVWEYPDIDLGNDTVICTGTWFTVHASSGYPIYQWNTGQTTSSLTISSPGEYILDVVNGGICRTMDTLIVDEHSCDPIMPNIFTPNSDGNNGYFLPIGNELTMIKLEVYNRWGQLMTRLEGPAVKWDGTNNTTDKECPEEVYYYIADIENVLGERFELAGFVHLNR